MGEMVLLPKDRVVFKIGKLECVISKLLRKHQIEIASLQTIEAGEMIENHAEILFRMLKYSVKEVKGLVDYNKEPIVIEAQKVDDKTYELTDDMAEILCNVDVREDLVKHIQLVMENKLNKIKGVEIKVGKN